MSTLNLYMPHPKQDTQRNKLRPLTQSLYLNQIFTSDPQNWQ